MPELPEVETVRRGLAPALEGASITHVQLRRPDLRIPFPEGMVKVMEGTKVERLDRRSKYLLFDLGEHTVLLHLGMSGRVTLHSIPSGLSNPMHQQSYVPKKHDHVLISFDNGTLLVFNDARRFGLMTFCPTATLTTHPLLASLAPEPFSEAFSANYLYALLHKRNTPIKHAIMDSRLVVGVGNIYASESLFRAGIHPATAAGKLSKKQVATLHRHMLDVLQEAIDSGGSTLRDYVRSDGGLGYFQHSFRVYGREDEPCVLCSTPVKRLVQQGRSSFYCPSCQAR